MASERVLRIFNELIELHKAKDTDYSGENGSLSNFRACEAFGVPAWKGAAIRMSDKWSRFMSLMANGESAAVKDEPLEDTLKDIAVYAVIVLALREYKYDEDVSRGKFERLDSKPKFDSIKIESMARMMMAEQKETEGVE